MSDEATRIARTLADINRLWDVRDFPPPLRVSLEVARRRMRLYQKDEYGAPEPEDREAASAIVTALDAFLTERTMHAAWRKRAEEAEPVPQGERAPEREK